MMKKYVRRIYLLIMLALSFIFGGASMMQTNAEEASPSVYASDISIQQGGYAYAYIQAENFVSVGSLELFVYYDEKAFSISSNSATGLLSGEMVSTNVAIAGEAELFAASANGISGSGNLWQITFRVDSNASVGSYPITIAVGEASGMDFQPIDIVAENFYIHVTEKPTYMKTTSFYATNPSSIKKGESTTISYYVSGHSNNFSSAEFEIDYDDTLLSLDSVKLGWSLTNVNGALISVNDSVSGYVKISFAALAGVNSYIYSSDPMFTLTFSAVKNEAATAEITMDATALYDIDLNAINGNSVMKSVTILYEEPVAVLPKIQMSSYSGFDTEFTVDIIADKETGLAAGDFVVTYNSQILSCTFIQKGIQSATVVSNIKKDGNGKEIGQIKFSFLLSGGITEDNTLVKLKFVPISIGETVLGLTGTGFKNGNYQSVEAECIGGAANLIHDVVLHEAKAPTYFDCGWEAYETCKNCSYTTYIEIPALGAVLDEEINFGHSCSFHNNLTMNYYVPTSDLVEYDSFYLSVEKDVYEGGVWGVQTVELQGELTSSGYKFVFKGIGAAEAGNELRAVLYAQAGDMLYRSVMDVYSVKAYAYSRLEKSSDADFKTLLVDMLNYCAAAQTYFGVNTENLVNAGLTEAQKGLATQADAVVSDTSGVTALEGATAKIVGKSIIFNSNIEVKFYMDLSQYKDLSGISLRVAYTDEVGVIHATTIDSKDFVYDSSVGYYAAKLNNLNSAELRAVLTVEILLEETVISDTVYYSVETYAYNRLNNTSDETFKTLLKELMKYSDSAKNYFY